VEAYNQHTGEKRIFTREACLYGYRYSIFKSEAHEPYIITHVVLRLAKHPSFKLDYGDLKTQLAACPPLTPAKVREAVIRLRRQKLPDPSELGNAGSFFMNPLVSPSHFAQLKRDCPDMPSYPAKDGMTKLSAGWLIEQCGLKGARDGDVGTYPLQALVIVNYSRATGDGIARFAERVRGQVRARFGVELTPEVMYVE
ncbi:MAG: UDP-N-acetylenolpyruvoylglucosamine reductase, partial [Tannerella sp.]|nr:UDP-N-acetylenolpyruvoylglucosamine reductase [Tannerella sp.]